MQIESSILHQLRGINRRLDLIVNLLRTIAIEEPISLRPYERLTDDDFWAVKPAKPLTLDDDDTSRSPF